MQLQSQQKTQYLSRGDLTQRWNVSMSTIIKLHNDNKLPCIRIGKRFFYPLNQIEAYEIRNSFDPTQATQSTYKKYYKSTKINLDDVSKMSIEQIALLSMQELLELAREVNNNLIEAKGYKSWIDGVIAIKTLRNNQDINHNHSSGRSDYSYYDNYRNYGDYSNYNYSNNSNYNNNSNCRDNINNDRDNISSDIGSSILEEGKIK